MRKAYQRGAGEETQEQTFDRKVQDTLRINKYLSASGHCSRRVADTLIEAKRVKIDHEIAEKGSKVSFGQSVFVDDKKITFSQKHVYIILHKPRGITCTLEHNVAGNLADFMDYPKRIFPIGRLDKDSSGLLLLSSDGDIVNKILRSENNHEKEYVVRVHKDIEQAFIKAMSEGVEITNTRFNTRETTKKCSIVAVDARTFKIVLTQGLNRQIRRMCSELGYRVVKLKRVRIMHLLLADLQVGEWRYMSQTELDTLANKI
ncbi:MAG: pseudouridine synthase [Breznakia sp.]